MSGEWESRRRWVLDVMSPWVLWALYAVAAFAVAAAVAANWVVADGLVDGDYGEGIGAGVPSLLLHLAPGVVGFPGSDAEALTLALPVLAAGLGVEVVRRLLAEASTHRASALVGAGIAGMIVVLGVLPFVGRAMYPDAADVFQQQIGGGGSFLAMNAGMTSARAAFAAVLLWLFWRVSRIRLAPAPHSDRDDLGALDESPATGAGTSPVGPATTAPVVPSAPTAGMAPPPPARPDSLAPRPPIPAPTAVPSPSAALFRPPNGDVVSDASLFRPPGWERSGEG